MEPNGNPFNKRSYLKMQESCLIKINQNKSRNGSSSWEKKKNAIGNYKARIDKNRISLSSWLKFIEFLYSVFEKCDYLVGKGEDLRWTNVIK